MTRRSSLDRSAIRGLALCALLLALLLRVLVPAGWMPAASGGFAVTLCTGQGSFAAWIDADGKLHKQAPGDERGGGEMPCAFAALGLALLAPIETIVALAPRIFDVPAPGRLEIGVGRGLAAPPPPATGPPANR